jgi:hypothetical protein
VAVAAVDPVVDVVECVLVLVAEVAEAKALVVMGAQTPVVVVAVADTIPETVAVVDLE